MDRSDLCGLVVVHVLTSDRVVINVEGASCRRLLLVAVWVLLKELIDLW